MNFRRSFVRLQFCYGFDLLCLRLLPLSYCSIKYSSPICLIAASASMIASRSSISRVHSSGDKILPPFFARPARDHLLRQARYDKPVRRYSGDAACMIGSMTRHFRDLRRTLHKDEEIAFLNANVTAAIFLDQKSWKLDYLCTWRDLSGKITSLVFEKCGLDSGSLFMFFVFVPVGGTLLLGAGVVLDDSLSVVVLLLL